MPTHRRNHAFTLVELAVVLVVVALIFGSVLLARDIIKVARVRGAISEIGKIDTSVQAFRLKYNALPGDMPAYVAEQYQFVAGPIITVPGRPTDSPMPGRGDGSGSIDGCAPGAVALGCETALFWVDLSKAKFLEKPITAYDGSAAYVPDTDAAHPITNYLFSSKLRPTASLLPYGAGGRTYLALGAVTVIAGVVSLKNNVPEAAVTPFEGKRMDEKLDDGVPSTGSVIAITDVNITADPGVSTPAANKCVFAPGPAVPTYMSTEDEFLHNPACALSIRTSF